MSEVSNLTAEPSRLETTTSSGLDALFFAPQTNAPIVRLRSLLCLLTAVYFANAMMCVGAWLVGEAPMSTQQFPAFLKSMGVDDELGWSPLYLADSWLGGAAIWYQLYALIGIGLCIAVALGLGGTVAPWLLWLAFVGWANRLILLSGLTELLISLSLFAAAFAPAQSMLIKFSDSESHWRARFAASLMGIQISLFLLATFATMMAKDIWWNGMGGFALAAPAADRWLAFGAADSLLSRSSWLCDAVTHFLVFALPVGVLLAWSQRYTRWGVGVLTSWALLVAFLGSHWIYSLTIIICVMAIPTSRFQASDR